MNTKYLLIRISFIALFAAITAATAFFAFNLGPVPIVLQNMLVVLSGIILGPFLGMAATGLFLLAGLIGFPVFSSGTGGIAHFAGPTGGYLIGYLLAAILGGLIAGKATYNTPIVKVAIAAVAGFLIIYVPGIIWLKISLDMDWSQAFLGGFFPFLAGDAIKAAAVIIISPRLRRIAANYLDGK